MYMRKALVYIKRLCYVLLGVYCLAIVLTSTYVGTRMLVSAAQFALPGKLTAKEISGSLTQGLYIDNLVYRDSTGRTQIETLQLKLSLSSLMLMHVYVEQLKVNNVSIYIGETNADNAQEATTDSTFSPPTWLRLIDLNKVDIRHVHVFHSKNTFKLESALISNTAAHQYQYEIKTNLGQLAGTIELGFSPAFKWAINLDAKKINIPSLTDNAPSAINLRLKTNGAWDSRQQNASLSLDHLSGQVDGKKVSGTALVTYKTNDLQIVHLNLFLGNTHLEGKGHVSDHSNLTWNLTIPNMGILVPDTKGQLTTKGSISGSLSKPNVDASILINHLKTAGIEVRKIRTTIKTVNANTNQIDVNIAAKHVSNESFTLQHAKVDIETKLTNSGLQTDINGHLDKTTRLTGTIKLPGFDSFSNSKQKIDGTIQFDTPNLKNLPIKSLQISDLSGKLNSKLTIQGTVTKPAISLTAALVNAQMKVKAAGILLQNINVQTTYQPSKPLTLDASLKSGTGTATAKGRVNLGETDYHAVLSFNGQNLQVANTNEYKVTVSPNVNVSLSKEGADVSGNILIPSALITPIEFTSVTNIPEETTFVHKKDEGSPFFQTLALDLKAKLGDDIHIKYEGFKTRLAGQLHIMKARGSLPTANGRLSTKKGSYRAYGTELDIERGRVIYAGNQISNPGLDVRAVKVINNYSRNSTTAASFSDSGRLTVGINVVGTAKKPRLTFFSTPGGLSQKDIISYIMFGSPANKVGGGSALALLNSLAPGGSNAGGVVDNIEDTLGITDLGVGTTDLVDPKTKETKSSKTANIGKDLGSDLSIHYSIGLLDSISVLNIRYQINRHLMLQTETSTVENGADLFYSLERK